jgi:predicted nucleotidyltransferase
MSPDNAATICETLCELHPHVIYQFGSQVSGQARDDSDLDLAILCPEAVDAVRLFDLANKLSNRLNLEVDLLDLSRASTVMAKEVLLGGQRIHVGNLPATQQFEMRTLADYARLNEERAAILTTRLGDFEDLIHQLGPPQRG